MRDVDALHIGGGITADNALEWIGSGAEKVRCCLLYHNDANTELSIQVIVTSYLFPSGQLSIDRLRDLSLKVGKHRLVIDVRYAFTPDIMKLY